MNSITSSKGGKTLIFIAGLVVCMVAFAATTLIFSPVPDTGFAQGMIVRAVAIEGDACTLNLATPQGPMEIPGLMAEECADVSVGDDVTEALLGDIKE